MNTAIILIILFLVGCNESDTKSKIENEQITKVIRISDNIKSDVDTLLIKKRFIDLKSFYNEYNLNGAFIFYNKNKSECNIYNDILINNPVTPASTFNIVTGLIALEDGICKDEKSIIKWDGHKSGNPLANNDITLQFAFQNNVDWAFWELRKKIGKDRMNFWLQKLRYGILILPNKIDSTNGTDDFWVVNSDIRTTPYQQLEFVRKLYYNKLPFSKKSIDKIKELMYQTNIKGYKIYGKRGSYQLKGENKYIGWFIGYAEKNSNVNFFVNFLQTSNLFHPSIVDAQKNIAYNILSKSELLK